MIELSHLEDHLRSLKKQDWSTLFVLMDQMNVDQKFGQYEGYRILPDGALCFPYYQVSAGVADFVKVVYQLNILPNFDWPAWIEGREILKNPSQDYGGLDVVTLCKLLTVIIRADRFNEGFLISCFEQGTVQWIVGSLKDKISLE